MSRGKWFFSCTAFDRMENSTAQAEYDDRVELKATEEVGAIEEARVLWEERSKRIRKEWNEGSYPKNPRVFYEVLWPKE